MAPRLDAVDSPTLPAERRSGEATAGDERTADGSWVQARKREPKRKTYGEPGRVAKCPVDLYKAGTSHIPAVGLRRGVEALHSERGTRSPSKVTAFCRSQNNLRDITEDGARFEIYQCLGQLENRCASLLDSCVGMGLPPPICSVFSELKGYVISRTTPKKSAVYR